MGWTYLPNDDAPMTIFRKHLGLSAIEVACKAGVTPATVRNLEGGLSPSFRTWTRLRWAWPEVMEELDLTPKKWLEGTVNVEEDPGF